MLVWRHFRKMLVINDPVQERDTSKPDIEGSLEQEERKSEKRKSQKKEDAGARKGKKVAKHCIFPMICGSRGIQKQARWSGGCGAIWPDPRWKNCTPLWREAHFQVKMYKAHQPWNPFGSWDVQKVCSVVARSAFPSQHVKSTSVSDHFWRFRCWFCVAGARDSAPCQKWAKREGFLAYPKTMAGVEHLNRICKDAFSVAGAVQETSSSELFGGQVADFPRGIAFWSIRSSGLLRWFCVTGAALCMTWPHFFVAGAIL